MKSQFLFFRSFFFCLLFLTSCGRKPFVSNQLEDQEVHADGVDVQLNLEKEVFDNGLTVIAIENHKLPLFSFYSFVKVGSRHEGKGMTGASHYLEHMMFKGSKKYAPGEFEKIVIGNGGTNNAYTSRDLTVYYESLPTSALDKILDLELDRLFNLSLEKESFERERSVILEERKLRTENSPRGQLYLETMKTVFKGTPYAHPPIGFIDDIKNVSLEEIRDYFHIFYDPANIVIVVSGDIKADKLISKMKKTFGKIPSLKKFKEKEHSQEDYRFRYNWKRKKKIDLYGKSPVPMFFAVYPSHAIKHHQSPALDILGSILAGGKSSYLSQKYVYGKRPLLSDLYAYNYSMSKGGIFILGGQFLKKTGVRSFTRILQRDLRKICKKAISDREVEKVKNQYLSSYFSSFETNAGLCQLAGENEVHHGDPLYFKKSLKRYTEMTSDEVMKVCYEIVEKNRPLFISVWDKHKRRK